jgi:hypothetical protein
VLSPLLAGSPLPPPGPGPINATVCELVKTPEAYAPWPIRIHAYVGQGFEDLSLHDPECPIGDGNGRGVPTSVDLGVADDSNPFLRSYIPIVNDANLSAFRNALRDRAGTSQMTGHSDGEERVVIVVARPYWLLPLAGTPEKVIWAPLGASLLNCVPNTPTAPSPSHRHPAWRECP